MTEFRKEKIENTIDANLLWKGIGGHFDSLSQILYELIDNSISNFSDNPNLAHRTILVHFDTSDIKNKKVVHVTVEDTGTGILNLNEAFTLGSQEAKESPLNEHGFGLKHGLASANKNNDAWAVYTRTKLEVENEEVAVISAPYKTEEFYAFLKPLSRETYPTRLKNTQTGTIVQFTTNIEMFESIAPAGIKKAISIVDFLVEDIGYVYSLLLKEGAANIQVQLDKSDKKTIGAIVPNWEATLSPGNGVVPVDLGVEAGVAPTGKIKLEYNFGIINSRSRTKGSHISPKYYTKHIRSQGVEIRINGRLIKNNLLSEIWPKKVPHNSMNAFLVIINLVSEEAEALPPTRSSKNGFKAGDPRLIGVFNWVAKKMQEPYENKYQRSEDSLLAKLATNKQNTYQEDFPDLIVEREKQILKNGRDSLRIDLYVSFNQLVNIYECKKDETDTTDLYQLLSYWDGLTIEEANVTTGYLVAPKHSPSVKLMVNYLNKLKDGMGREYNFKLRTWFDENIEFPEKIIK